MTSPVAIVTGGSSGIGLALSKYLIDRDWSVVIADLQPPIERLHHGQVRYIKTEISSWDSQASMFRDAFAWYSQLDFCALNAGIDDKDDIFQSISRNPSKPPSRPNMIGTEINLIGQYYGLKLAAHYMTLDSTAAGKLKPGGKIVFTASSAGIYPVAIAPIYSAAKHGVVDLVQSLHVLSTLHHITLNAVCPHLVDTPLVPSELVEHYKKRSKPMTSMTAILRAFDELADLEGVGRIDWVEQGRNGQAVEVWDEDLIYHKAKEPEPGKYEEEEKMMWARVYLTQNKRYADQFAAKQRAHA